MKTRNINSLIKTLEEINLDPVCAHPTLSNCKLIYNQMIIVLFVMADLTKENYMQFYEKKYDTADALSYELLSSASIIALKHEYDSFFEDNLRSSLDINAQQIRRELFLKNFYQNKFKAAVESYSLVEQAKNKLKSIFIGDPDTANKNKIRELLNQMVSTFEESVTFLKTAIC